MRKVQLSMGKRGDLIAFAHAPDHWVGDPKMIWVIRGLPETAAAGDWVHAEPQDPHQPFARGRAVHAKFLEVAPERRRGARRKERRA